MSNGITDKKDNGSGGSCTFNGIYTQPSGNVSGTTCQDWIDLHFSTQPPIAHINSVVPACGLREEGDTITNPVIQFRATQGANGDPLDRIEIRRNGTLIHTESPAVYGTVYTFNDTYTTNAVDTTYQVRAIDTGARTHNTSCTLNFVLPWYATTANITTLTKQSLVDVDSYYQATLVAETPADKFKVDIIEALTGVQIYNVLSGTWDFMGGSKANSLALWTQSNVNHTVQGNIVNYNRYTHNGTQNDSAQLRFWVA